MLSRKTIYDKIFKYNRNKLFLIVAIFLITTFILGFYCVSKNEGFYNKTIAKITYIKDMRSKVSDINGKAEDIKKQQIDAIVMNGKYKNEKIQLENTASYSQANDLDLKVNDEIFISIQKSKQGKLSAKLLDFKRDKYILRIAILFVALILIVGGYKGFKSLASLIINIFILIVLIDLFSHGFNLILLSVIASILFVMLSIFMVCGINKKMISSIIATLLGTIITMIIAVIVIKTNSWRGVHFEEMEFLTHPPEQIFLIELLIGTLGGIMDIAISISSSLNELYDKNPDMDKKELIASGREIGKDIMGTMTNTLVFAYVSGSIPIVLLLMSNGYSISYIININLSLEVIRAIVGSIGIVLSIPISVYMSVAFFKDWRFLKI